MSLFSNIGLNVIVLNPITVVGWGMQPPAFQKIVLCALLWSTLFNLLKEGKPKTKSLLPSNEHVQTHKDFKS